MVGGARDLRRNVALLDKQNYLKPIVRENSQKVLQIMNVVNHMHETNQKAAIYAQQTRVLTAQAFHKVAENLNFIQLLEIATDLSNGRFPSRIFKTADQLKTLVASLKGMHQIDSTKSLLRMKTINYGQVAGNLWFTAEYNYVPENSLVYRVIPLTAQMSGSCSPAESHGTKLFLFYYFDV